MAEEIKKEAENEAEEKEKKKGSEKKSTEKKSSGEDKKLKSELEKMSVTPYGEPGEAFDPNIHDAMMHVEREDLGENVIADVFQKGYKKDDRVLRHAMVTVAN